MTILVHFVNIIHLIDKFAPIETEIYTLSFLIKSRHKKLK